MSKIDAVSKKQRNKAIGAKVAEIIWIVIGGIVLLSGVLSLILSVIVNNVGSDTSVMYNSPLYFFVEFQDIFKSWWNSWFPIKFTNFLNAGIWLVIIACAYFLIVLGIFAARQDAKDKKEKARKLREKNAMKFKEQQAANEAQRAEAI